MRHLSHTYWVLWFAVGFGIPEIYALLHPEFQTLSSTWRWLRDTLPPGLSLIMSAAMGAALLWLLSVHWIFSSIDRPGLDKFESLSVAAGAILGIAGAVLARRRKP